MPYSEIDNRKNTHLLIIDKSTYNVEGIVVEEKIGPFRVTQDGKTIYGLLDDDKYLENIIKLNL